MCKYFLSQIYLEAKDVHTIYFTLKSEKADVERCFYVTSIMRLRMFTLSVVH